MVEEKKQENDIITTMVEEKKQENDIITTMVEEKKPFSWNVPENDEDLFHKCLRKAYFPCFVRFYNLILVFWVGLLSTCYLFGPKVLSNTRSNFDLPKSSPSTLAIEAFSEHYPSVSSWSPAFLVYNIPDDSKWTSVVCRDSRRVSESLAEFVSSYPSVVGQVTGYWELIDIPGLELLARAAVAPNNKTMISTVSFRQDTNLDDIDDFVYDFLAFCEGQSTVSLSVAATGLMPLFNQMAEDTEHNFVLIDSIVLPCALIIFTLRLRSYRHMFIALVNLVCTLLLSFTILLPISDLVDINPFAPSVMMSLGIAVSFDYSLFMMARFKEERLGERRSLENSVFLSLSSAGHVVLLSGFTLFLTFVLLVFFPQNFLVSVGYGCGAVMVSAMFCNLTITPAALLALSCFSHFELFPSDPARSCCCRVPAVDGDDVSAGSGGTVVGERERSESACCVASCPRESCFFNTAWLVSHPKAKVPVLVLILGMTVPFAMLMARLVPTSDYNLLYLQGSSSLAALNQMHADFPEGALDPYQLIVTSADQSVLSAGYFAIEAALVQTLLDNLPTYIDASSIEALSFFQGQSVSFGTASGYFNSLDLLYNTSLPSSYRTVIGGKLSADLRTSLVTIKTLTDPNSHAMVDMINFIRDLIASWPQTPDFPVEMHLFGAYTTTMDLQNALYKLVPLEVGGMVGLVMVVVGASFGSAGLALRLTVTVFISLAWAYGLMVLIYQPGPAQELFAKLTPILEDSSGVYWIIPIMSFSILVGLALDYDIFLMSRVVEFRKQGWSDRAAMCLAIEKTGSIITSAGLIMCVSFAGLLLTNTLVLQQYGFSLFIGVFIDTFIVRVVLVPWIVGFFSCGSAQANWWPSVMPPVLLTPAEEERCLRRGQWSPQEPTCPRKEPDIRGMRATSELELTELPSNPKPMAKFDMEVWAASNLAEAH